MSINDLSEFLLARIAADERTGVFVEQPRWLAECAAKRRIATLYAAYPGANWTKKKEGYREATTDVLQLLALPYADHPDYRAEWRPT